MKIWTLKLEFSFEVDDLIFEQVLGRDFLPERKSYRSEGHELIVPLSDIEPIKRDVGKQGFRDDASIANILRGFKSNSLMPPVEVSNRHVTPGYIYRLKDGFHRYCLSIAVGFTDIPVVINNFELSDLDEI